jgi:hypothetical protein
LIGWIAAGTRFGAYPEIIRLSLGVIAEKAGIGERRKSL